MVVAIPLVLSRMPPSHRGRGNGIVFTGVGGTLMFCEGVDTWLSQMDSATIEGDEMHIRDDGGAEIGSLTKQ